MRQFNMLQSSNQFSINVLSSVHVWVVYRRENQSIRNKLLCGLRIITMLTVFFTLIFCDCFTTHAPNIEIECGWIAKAKKTTYSRKWKNSQSTMMIVIFFSHRIDLIHSFLVASIWLFRLSVGRTDYCTHTHKLAHTRQEASERWL